jgi:hypothetical protein
MVASHLIARVPLPPFLAYHRRTGWEMGGQTGQDMDDLGAITDRGGYVFIQAKLRLRLAQASEVICSSMVHKLPGTA